MQVVWRESKIPFARRFNKYLDPNFFQHRVSGVECVGMKNSESLLSLVVITLFSGLIMHMLKCTFAADPLVLHLQLLHDGDIPGGPGEHDPHEDTAQGLCQIQPRGGAG